MLCLFQTQKYVGGGYPYYKIVGVVYGGVMRGGCKLKIYKIGVFFLNNLETNKLKKLVVEINSNKFVLWHYII